MIKSDPIEIYNRLKERVAKEPLPTEQVYYDLAARLVPGDREIMPRIIARLANPDQAKLLAALPDPDSKPISGKSLEVSDSFVARMNMEKALVEQHIKELFEKGIVFPTKKGPAMARNILQLHDAALGNPKYDDQLGQIYYDLWGYFEGPMIKPSSKDLHPDQAEFRVVPRWPAIKNVPGVQPWEDARAILRSQQLIVLIHCGCKRAHTERWCDVPEEVCLTFGRTAQYNLDRGMGRKISCEDAIELIEKLDRLPAVHTTVNQREVTQLLCNCHYCCCIAIKPSQKSRFIVQVDPQKCRGCKLCVERCQFNACSMIKYDGIKGEKAYTDPDICRGCGSCVITCKSGARTMKLVRPLEHVPESLTIY